MDNTISSLSNLGLWRAPLVRGINRSKKEKKRRKKGFASRVFRNRKPAYLFFKKIMEALFARSKQSCELTCQHDRMNGQARSMNSGVNFLCTKFQTTSHRGNELQTKEQPHKVLVRKPATSKQTTFRRAMTKKNECGIRNPNESP